MGSYRTYQIKCQNSETGNILLQNTPSKTLFPLKIQFFTIFHSAHSVIRLRIQCLEEPLTHPNIQVLNVSIFISIDADGADKLVWSPL